MNKPIGDSDSCINCGEDFADHNYVKDSIDKYECPHPHTEAVYGGFHGGDPRQFHPDAEECTDSEIESHRAACELWDLAEARGETPTPEACASGWRKLQDGTLIHVLKRPYGIGIMTHESVQHFEQKVL